MAIALRVCLFFVGILTLSHCDFWPRNDERDCDLSGGCMNLQVNFVDGFQTFAADNFPYAQGTRLRLFVATSGTQPIDKTGWQVSSTRPEILFVEKQTLDGGILLIATVSALAEGDAQIEVRDADGNLLSSQRLRVRKPDEVRVMAVGPLLLLRKDQQGQEEGLSSAAVNELRVMVGGKGVFAVVYYQGGQRLFGHGILKTPDATAEVQTQLLLNDGTGNVVISDFLMIEPSKATGDAGQPMSFAVAKQELATLPVIAVESRAAKTVELAQQNDPHFLRDGSFLIWARVRDELGRDIHGTICAFTINNDPIRNAMNMLVNRGDLLNYVYDDKQPILTVGADCPEMKQRGSLQIRGPIDRIKVTATERVGIACQYAPHSTTSSRFVIALLFLCLALLRRGARFSARFR